MNRLQRSLTSLRAGAGQLSHRRAASSIDGLRVALVTTRERSSGKQGSVPLQYVEDGERIALAAANAGSNRHPAWYLNVRAQPEVTVELAGGTKQMEATVAAEPDRTRLYEAFKRRSPTFARYERKSARTIPIVLLRNRSDAA